MPSEVKAYTLRLDTDLAERLAVVAWVLRVPQSDVVRDAIAARVAGDPR